MRLKCVITNGIESVIPLVTFNLDLNYNLRIFNTLILLFYIQRFGLIRPGKTHKNKEITNLFTVAIIVNYLIPI